MKNKIWLTLTLFFLASVMTLNPSNLVHKILYKKVIIKYNQTSIINVIFHPLAAQINEIYVYFNSNEILEFNRNLTPFGDEKSQFNPSISFEVDHVKQENFLEIFVILKNDKTLNYDGIIYFEKGMIVEDNNFIIPENQVFFVKVSDDLSHGIYYDLQIENAEIINKLDEVVFEGTLYYRMKTKNVGNSRLLIYKYDKALENQIDFPLKIIHVTSR